MASPQKENGYTAIANELMEALSAIRISGEARQCLDVIFRKTYGYNKQDDNIALSQFVKYTKMPKATICRALLKLVKMNIIIVKNDNDIGNNYRILKDYTQWKPLTKKIIIDKKDNGHYQKRQLSLTKKGHTKDNITKDNITKQIATSVAVEELVYEEEFLLKDKTLNKQIFSLMETFREFNPGINIAQKTHRKSCEELIKQFGYEKALNTVKWTLLVQGREYCPTITTPTQLINKLGDLKVYAERQKNQTQRIVKI
jgi:phage replication O-like protein O